MNAVQDVFGILEESDEWSAGRKPIKTHFDKDFTKTT